MYRVLAVISDEDRDKGLLLSSIVATYQTLLEIEEYEIDKTELKGKIIKARIELLKYWNHISAKYMFPLYLDKTMRVSHDDNSVYIEE